MMLQRAARSSRARGEWRTFGDQEIHSEQMQMRWMWMSLTHQISKLSRNETLLIQNARKVASIDGKWN